MEEKSCPRTKTTCRLLVPGDLFEGISTVWIFNGIHDLGIAPFITGVRGFIRVVCAENEEKMKPCSDITLRWKQLF